MRCIDKAGGFDSYIYHTPDHKLNSTLGNYLKEEMHKVITDKGLPPPQLIKRYPQPPRSLTTREQKINLCDDKIHKEIT